MNLAQVVSTVTITVTVNIGFKMNNRLVIVYEPTLIRFGSDILKIVAASVFLTLLLPSFFFENRVNFGCPNSA